MTALEELTEAQRRLVEQPADARLLVTAAAGTGKTFTLVKRLVHLIEEEGLDAADLLVLSFSRAAVREVRNRLLRHRTAATHVEVRTFDSYATWILSELTPDGPWQRQSFDRRIREATKLIKEDPDAVELVGETRHLIVDEVQDLVGDRADLVKALLETDLDGFTLLGDPAQGIYGFQLDNPQDRMSGAALLYQWLRDRFAGELVEAALTENFRAREPEAEVALPYGPSLGAVDAHFGDIQRRLRTKLLSGDSLGTLDQAAPVLSRLTTPTALLCRANDEALLISRQLHTLGVPHRLQRAAQDRVIPSWVGAVFLELDSRQPAKAAVQDVLRRHGGDPDEGWDLLQRMNSNRRGEVLDLTAVRRRLARGDVPDELTQQPPETLVVSTIHRIKGMEFDQVVLVDPGDAPDDDPVEQAERARLLYVAMTRPRDLLIHMKPLGRVSKGFLRKQSQDRWVEVGFKPGQRLGMEVRAEDVNAEEPAGTLGFQGDAGEIQRYLAARVLRGDAVALVRTTGVAASEGSLEYVVEHEGRGIGVTTAGFSQAMRLLLPGRDHRPPSAVRDLHVDCVETVVGREAAGMNAGLGWSGVWLRPRIIGLGRFDWDGKQA
ncbi:UvrD-helicase domain-containing protein [Nonomuraea muscovyensis]